MPHKQELTENQKSLMEKASKAGLLSKVSKPALTAADIKRKARNKRKALAKIPFIIIPLPGRTGNPKKNQSVRRARGKLATYVPFVLTSPRMMKNTLTGKRTVFAGYRGFLSKFEDQKKINDALIVRAHQARAAGGYFHINPTADHGKNRES